MTNLTQHQKYYICLNNIMKDTRVSLKEKTELLQKYYNNVKIKYDNINSKLYNNQVLKFNELLSRNKILEV